MISSSSKTTITGLVGAAASFIMFSQQLHMIEYPQWLLAVAMFVAVGGFAFLGITAKDYNATGGNVPVNKEAEKRIDAAGPLATLPPDKKDQ